ncbi:MAG TPA: hypothetical protein VFZ58_01425 [Candidatus Saccharimonadales bacterium]
MSQTINKKVAITALSFRQNNGLESFPKRMEYAGDSIAFLDGLQCHIKKGREVIRIFTMTDGEREYKLRSNSKQDEWLLVAIMG